MGLTAVEASFVMLVGQKLIENFLLQGQALLRFLCGHLGW